MIRDGDITAETSLRMGERPWIKAAEIANFRELFPEFRRDPKKGPLESMTLIDATDTAEEGKPSGPPFYEELPAIIQYPVSGGGWQALAIFAGIAFVLCAALSFEFLVGLPVSLIGWIILYGYLGTLMQLSSQSPASPPPNWNFGAAKEMVAQGGKILLVVVVCSLLPVGILVLGMIACFLNSAPLVGYILMALIGTGLRGLPFHGTGRSGSLGQLSKGGDSIQSRQDYCLGQNGRAILSYAGSGFARRWADLHADRGAGDVPG